MFSSPVSRLSTAENWPVTPIAARTPLGSVARSCPATWISPALAVIRVDRMCTIVVLPAPLGPSSEKMVPSGTVRSMPSSTTLSPNDLRSPVTEMAGRVVIMVVTVTPSQALGRGTADQDVAVAGGRVHLGGLVGRPGAFRGGQVVENTAEFRGHVEPGGGAGPDADLDLAEAGFERGRAAGDFADPDVAVGRAGGDAGAGPANGDVTVGRIHPQVAADLADPAVAVGVLDHRAAINLAQAYLARPGA